MNEGKKDDTGKARMDLLPPDALFAVANVLRHGAEKYGQRNWEKGIPFGRLFSAVLRHMFAWWGGEDRDKDSGHLHLAHAATGLLMLLSTSMRRPHLDDRFPLSKRETLR